MGFSFSLNSPKSLASPSRKEVHPVFWDEAERASFCCPVSLLRAGPTGSSRPGDTRPCVGSRRSRREHELTHRGGTRRGCPAGGSQGHTGLFPFSTTCTDLESVAFSSPKDLGLFCYQIRRSGLHPLSPDKEPSRSCLRNIPSVSPGISASLPGTPTLPTGGCLQHLQVGSRAQGKRPLIVRQSLSTSPLSQCFF